jgi:formate hydrogenlyase subunit 3/multisubunit Na+/H+ antiporter MnhD subunit
VNLLLDALLLIVTGGTGALLLSKWPGVASTVGMLGVLVGAVLGEAAAVNVLLSGWGDGLTLSWNILYGDVRVAIDPLSAFFLVPVFGLGAVTAVYGREYLMEYRGKKPLGFAWFAFNILLSSMAVVVIARQALLFLVAWEVMSLAAYVLVTFEHERPEVRRAGWVYLIATHIGTAFLVAMFLIMGRRAHSFDFDLIRDAETSAGSSALLFAMALAGFGVKAGFVPLHVWLPEAHAAAPSHVSALMSGVLIKVGLYGLLRSFVLLGPPAVWWGPVLVTLGLAGGLLGISLALYQRDMKRVLAYSSIENMGLITIGIGTGLWGSSTGRPEIAWLGATGALLHVWNHTLMKGLMFLGAGSVLHGCHTKDLDKLGGLMKRMPRTSTILVLGAVAISGLPPMNGFVSEWLLYLGLIRGGLSAGHASGVAMLLAVGLVALIGGLAMVCFVRLVGIALLGEPRSEAASLAHESPVAMTAPIMVLAAASVGVALVPEPLVAAISNVSGQLLRTDVHEAIAGVPLASIGLSNAILWLVLALGAVVWLVALRRPPLPSDATWGCGYANPSPRMQYTSSSFAEFVSERLLPRSLRARMAVVAPRGLFPTDGSLSSEASDPLTRGLYEPFVARWGDRFARLRWLQQGALHLYLVYILFTALLALAWTSFSAWSGR